LIPKENLGIYVATNSLSGLPFDFEEEFLNYFYPHSNNFNIEKINSSEDYSKYEGTYRSYDGISKTNIMKMAVLFDDDMEIKDNKDGTLTLHETTQSKERITTKLMEIENGVFLREDGKGKFTFKFDNYGKVTYAFNDISINSFEKLKFYEQSKFIILSIGIIVITFIINIMLFALSFIKRKNKVYKNSERTKIIEILKYANICIEIFYIIGGLGVIISTLEMCLNSEYNLSYLLYSLLTMLIIATIIVIVSLALSIYSLIKKKGIIRQRLYYMFLNMMNLGFIWFLCYFNFLGYKLF
ncbi:serine hydrolase, partial [Clostridium butyricum]